MSFCINNAFIETYPDGTLDVDTTVVLNNNEAIEVHNFYNSIGTLSKVSYYSGELLRGFHKLL